MKETPLDRELQATELARIMSATYPDPLIFLGCVVTDRGRCHLGPAGSLLSGSAYFRVRRHEYSSVELGALVYILGARSDPVDRPCNLRRISLAGVAGDSHESDGDADTFHREDTRRIIESRMISILIAVHPSTCTTVSRYGGAVDTSSSS